MRVQPLGPEAYQLVEVPQVSDGLSVFLLVVLFFVLAGTVIGFITGSYICGCIAIPVAFMVGLIGGNILA